MHSLAAYYPAPLQAGRVHPATDQPVVRLSIGLEGVEILKEDLRRALDAYARQAR
ncbi:hypothetical protein D3C72_2394040 [compost metagenome]